MNEFSQGAALWQGIAAILIFAAAYMLILIEKWNRTYIALGGAAGMLLLGIIPFKLAWTVYARWDALLLILGVFIYTAVFRKSGVVTYIAMKAIHWTKAKPIPMLLVLSVVSAFGAAALDGVAVIAALIPVTLQLARLYKITPLPFIIAEMLACNLGGAATLTGSMTNRIIGTAAGLSFTRFLVIMAPLMLLLLVIALTALVFIYGKRFIVSEAQRKELLMTNPLSFLRDLTYARACAFAAVLVLAAFCFHSMLGIAPEMIALGGAFVFMAIHYKEVRDAFVRKDVRGAWKWLESSMLPFFLGLFIMTGGLVHTGLIGFMAARALEMTQGSVPLASMIVLGLSALGSATLDQVPLAAAVSPFIQELGSQLNMDAGSVDPQPLWWALAIGASIGGGATLIGSSVNLFAAGLIMREGQSLSFANYFKIAGPISMLLLLISFLYVQLILL